MRPWHAAAARRRARAYFCGLPPPPLSSGSGGEERSHMTRRRRRLAQRHSAVSAERTRMRQWPAASSARSVQRPFVTQRGSGGTGWWHQPASGGALPSADAWPRLSLTAGAVVAAPRRKSTRMARRRHRSGRGGRDGSSGS